MVFKLETKIDNNFDELSTKISELNTSVDILQNKMEKNLSIVEGKKTQKCRNN